MCFEYVLRICVKKRNIVGLTKENIHGGKEDRQGEAKMINSIYDTIYTEHK